MNFSLLDLNLRHQRCRQWIPLVTQQLRLRHLRQVIAMNMVLDERCQLYFTLHLTSMSAPFYTSLKVSSVNPKWSEIDTNMSSNCAASTVVLRIWRHDSISNTSKIILTWGIHFSGLMYVGNKISNIQPVHFEENVLVLQMHDGYFTSHDKVKMDIPKLIKSKDSEEKCIRLLSFRARKNELTRSYDIEKLRRLHSLQISIKNRSLDVQNIVDKLHSRSALNVSSNENNETVNKTFHTPVPNVKYAPQLLTMTSLNKMLYEKPTKLQRQEMFKIKKDIEISKFTNRLLLQEKMRKLAMIRQLKESYSNIIEKNDETSIEITENYHTLEKEFEKLKQYKENILRHKELLIHTNSLLLRRKKHLLQQLLFIYPIVKITDTKYVIHGIYLPNSDVLADCSSVGLSVALGYVAHVLQMCSIILQVPLRYPVKYFGSRSFITDNISSKILDKDRDFPLFTRGKEKMQFTYAVYLLNKNIAQLRWLFFMHTSDLKATLPNLLGLLSLNIKDSKAESIPPLSSNIVKYYGDQLSFGSNPNIYNPLAECGDENTLEKKNSSHKTDNLKLVKGLKTSQCGPGLSDILSVSGTFSKETFHKEVTLKEEGESFTKKGSQNIIVNNVKEYNNFLNTENNGCTLKHSISIEQGTDLLNPSLNISSLENEVKEICLDLEDVDAQISTSGKNNCDSTECPCNETETVKPIMPCDIESQSSLQHLDVAGSYDGKQTRDSSANSSLRDSQHEFLKNWLKDDPSAFSYSDDNLSTEAVLDSSLLTSKEAPLMARTDALLSRSLKSFNLVKHEYS